MYQRSIAILAILAFVLGGSGCASKSSKDYDEVLMPAQTGSTLRRRVMVKADHQKKPTKKKKPAASKPEAEPSATPATEEESTPPPDRFR